MYAQIGCTTCENHSILKLHHDQHISPLAVNTIGAIDVTNSQPANAKFVYNY